jgi:hypothetical protein
MMSVSSRDREILRELGSRIAEIAALPIQQETIRRWKAINALQPERPMVMVDQLPWHELDVDGSLALKTDNATRFRLDLPAQLFDRRRTIAVILDGTVMKLAAGQQSAAFAKERGAWRLVADGPPVEALSPGLIREVFGVDPGLVRLPVQDPLVPAPRALAPSAGSGTALGR